MTAKVLADLCLRLSDKYKLLQILITLCVGHMKRFGWSYNGLGLIPYMTRLTRNVGNQKHGNREGIDLF
jgi:hypothetical protein